MNPKPESALKDDMKALAESIQECAWDGLKVSTRVKSTDQFVNGNEVISLSQFSNGKAVRAIAQVGKDGATKLTLQSRIDRRTFRVDRETAKDFLVTIGSKGFKAGEDFLLQKMEQGAVEKKV